MEQLPEGLTVGLVKEYVGLTAEQLLFFKEYEVASARVLEEYQAGTMSEESITTLLGAGMTILSAGNTVLMHMCDFIGRRLSVDFDSLTLESFPDSIHKRLWGSRKEETEQYLAEGEDYYISRLADKVVEVAEGILEQE